MSLISELGLSEYVYPLPHPDISPERLVLAYANSVELLNLRTYKMEVEGRAVLTDYWATKTVLGRFMPNGLTLEEGINKANTVQIGAFRIPCAGETKIGLPVGSITRAANRHLRDSLMPPLNSNRARELNYLDTLLGAYSTPALLEKNSRDWQQIAEEIAHELSIQVPGPDDLDNWDRAVRFLEDPVLMIP